MRYIRWHNTRLPKATVLLWLLLSCSEVWASVALKHSSQPLALQGLVELLPDPTSRLSFEQVRQLDSAFHSASAQENLAFGYVTGPIWMRLQVYSSDSQVRLWRLELDYASLDQVEFYNLGEDGLRHARAGDLVPREAHDLQHRSPLFEFRLQPGEHRTLYLRVQSDGTKTLSGKLWTLHAFEQHSQLGYIAQAAYLGVMAALGLYNLLLFVALREKPFFHYVLFLFSFGVAVLALNGLGAQFIWTSGDEWTARILPVSMILSCLLAASFTRSFLNTCQWLPRWDFVIQCARGLTFIAVMCSLFIAVPHALQMMSFIGIGLTSVLLLTGVICISWRVPGAKLFTLAWMILLCGAALLSLRNFALIPSNVLTLHAMQIGSSLEMVLLSLALAARFNENKRQREAILQDSERQLEQRVASRTLELEQANQRLLDLALSDPLTGLANRTALQQHLSAGMSRAQRSKQKLAVMLIDLDDFKPVNDQYGHPVGDQVLVVVAQRLRQSIRDIDLPARLGGDEFVVVCENVYSIDNTKELAQRILEALSQPIHVEDLQLCIGASIGITLHHPCDSPTSLLKRADSAMYSAKAKGRHRFYFIDSDSPHTQTP